MPLEDFQKQLNKDISEHTDSYTIKNLKHSTRIAINTIIYNLYSNAICRNLLGLHTLKGPLCSLLMDVQFTEAYNTLQVFMSCPKTANAVHEGLMVLLKDNPYDKNNDLVELRIDHYNDYSVIDIELDLSLVIERPDYNISNMANSMMN